ncbi:MAG: ABC transporter permease subunit, partial [Paracraurococcus sp.]
MSQSTTDPRMLRAPPKRPLRLSWSDERVRGIVWQVLVVGLIGAVVWWLWSNTVHNLEVRRIATGFGFLRREAGLPIAESLIEYNPTDTYLRALMVGLLNTLKVAVVGIVLATLLGTLVGIARLSRNWLLAKLAAVYVEVIRDLPLLLQLLFW